MDNRLEVGDLFVSFSGHALDRYRDRVKPHLGRSEALADLLTMRESATLGGPPSWAEDNRDSLLSTTIDEWVYYGNEIAFPIRQNVAITCITRGSISDISRTRRNRKRYRRPHKKPTTGMPNKRSEITLNDWS